MTLFLGICFGIGTVLFIYGVWKFFDDWRKS
jgi:hypothetical protein